MMLIGEKIESHYFFVESPDFFHGSVDFPLPGFGRSGTHVHVLVGFRVKIILYM